MAPPPTDSQSCPALGPLPCRGQSERCFVLLRAAGQPGTGDLTRSRTGINRTLLRNHRSPECHFFNCQPPPRGPTEGEGINTEGCEDASAPSRGRRGDVRGPPLPSSANRSRTHLEPQDSEREQPFPGVSPPRKGGSLGGPDRRLGDAAFCPPGGARARPSAWRTTALLPGLAPRSQGLPGPCPGGAVAGRAAPERGPRTPPTRALPSPLHPHWPLRSVSEGVN